MWGAINIPAKGVVVYISSADACAQSGLSACCWPACHGQCHCSDLGSLLTQKGVVFSFLSHWSDHLRGLVSRAVAWACCLARHWARRLCWANSFLFISHKPRSMYVTLCCSCCICDKQVSGRLMASLLSKIFGCCQSMTR